MGDHFSRLFINEFDKLDYRFREEYNSRRSNPKTKKLWTKNLIELKWKRDKALAERNVLYMHQDVFCCSIEEIYEDPDRCVDRKKYSFKPSPDSGRSEFLPPANCYSNAYTSLFYDWLGSVFFKYVWRDYILERDHDGWIARYNTFASLSHQQQRNILTTTEGKLIEGFEFRETWERQLTGTDQ